MQDASVCSSISGQVDEWEIQEGLCTRVSAADVAKYGTGIFVAKYMDLITRQVAPRFDYGPNATAEDYYCLLSIELLTAKLLNQ